MSSLSIGQFFPGNSPIHQLDARIKIISYLILLAAAATASGPLQYAWIVSIILIVVSLSKLPQKILLGSFRGIWCFFAVLFFMNAFFFDGSGVIWSWWIFHLTIAGIWQGVNVVLRIFLIFLLSNVLTGTTAPIEAANALRSLLKPLKFFHLPVEEAAMMISIAFRFIPTLSKEAQAIQKAQMARGAGFESRQLKEKAASVLPLVLPLFLSAFRHADALSSAMEARCYQNASRRTHWKQKSLAPSDCLVLAGCAAICTVQFLLPKL